MKRRGENAPSAPTSTGIRAAASKEGRSAGFVDPVEASSGDGLRSDRKGHVEIEKRQGHRSPVARADSKDWNDAMSDVGESVGAAPAPTSAVAEAGDAPFETAGTDPADQNLGLLREFKKRRSGEDAVEGARSRGKKDTKRKSDHGAAPKVIKKKRKKKTKPGGGDYFDQLFG